MCSYTIPFSAVILVQRESGTYTKRSVQSIALRETTFLDPRCARMTAGVVMLR